MSRISGAGIILLNSNNQVLLILRDNKPGIPFPGMWDIPGGHIEPGETAIDTVKREMFEEMFLELGQINLFKIYESEDLIDNVFWKKIDLDPGKIELMEGQKLQYFSRQDIKNLKLAFNYNVVIEEFFDHLENEIE